MITTGPAVPVADWLRRRPLLAVALVGVLVTVVHLVWTVRFRPLGTLNTDEAGYLAHALRIERAAGDDPGGLAASLGALWRSLIGTSAPLVPLLSAPLASVGGRSPHWAMSVQPVLHVVAAVGAAGISTRLSPSPSLRPFMTGLVVLGLPVMVLSSRSYQFAGAAAAALVLALWALLSSDSGRRLAPMLCFGAAVGALLLSRTMAVVYLPGLLVAVALVVEPTRRSLRNVVLAGAVTLIVAAPWWLASWSEATGYLLDYGYGTLSTEYGGRGLVPRGASMIGNALTALRLMVVPLLVVLGFAATRAWSSALSVRAHLRGRREALAVASVVVAGMGVLLTSSNSGLWFELPLLVVAVPLVVALSATMGDRTRVATGWLTAFLLAANIGATGFAVARSEADMVLLGDMYQGVPLLETTDPDLLADPGDRRRLGDQWWEAHVDTVRAFELLDGGPDPRRLVIAGSAPLMNYNSLLLAQEVALGRSRDTTVFDAATPDAHLGPTGAHGRLLVVIDAPSGASFPADAGSEAVSAAAARAGWTTGAIIALPDGGTVQLMVGPP